jgi:DNA-binding CsgD family transcriptional regulator
LERARRFSAMAQRAEVLEELIAAGRADCALAAWGLDGRALWLAPNADPALADLTQSGAPPSLASKWAAIVATMAHAAQRPIDTRIELPSGVRGDLWLCAAPRRGAPFVALLTARLDLQERVLRASARFALSAGEQRVLLALADGRSNAELSRDLFISIDTVRTHVQRILKKMRCDSRLKAVTRLQEL